MQCKIVSNRIPIHIHMTTESCLAHTEGQLMNQLLTTEQNETVLAP
jgi:hypothetical protein